MPSVQTTDVLIIGAGPCGLAMAGLLAKSNVEHVIVDRLVEPRPTSRAAAVQARTLEMLEPLDVPERLVDAGVVAQHFEIYAGEEKLTDISFSGLHTRYPFVLLLPQNETEAILENRLRELGGTVHRGWEVTGLADEPEQDAVVATVRSADGNRTVRARYVVGADGLHSMVRSAAGIGFQEGTYQQSFVLGDVRLDRELGPYALRLSLAEQGVMLTAPFGELRYRLIASVDDAPDEVDGALLQDMLTRRMPDALKARITRVQWASAFRIHHGVAAHMRAGNIFLAGDAAHVHSPAGGQGMNNGIQDACLLARLMVEALGADGQPSGLDAYEASRLPRAREVVDFTDRITRALTVKADYSRHLRDWAIEALGSVPPLRQLFARNLAELKT